MARVYVVQHTPDEGLGRLAEWLPARGLDVHPTHPYLGNRVPTSVEGDALIVLGGPMNAYDDEVAPWLPSVRDLLQSAVEDGVPTLGICLGAQLLAVATGGEVRPGDHGPEHGLSEVTIEPTAEDDPLLRPGPLPVVQWHRDAVTRLPDGAVLLASSEPYRHQAFRLGDAAWGIQFHIEATPEMVSLWAANDQESPEIVDAVVAAQPDLVQAGEQIARRFAALVTG